MKHIYLFITDSRAGDYGIGTYLRELVACIRVEQQISLTVVELQSTEKEFSVVAIDGVRHIRVPSPNVSSYWLFQSKKMECYNLAVSCLLKSYVDLSEANVFHLNYLQHDSLIPHLRELSPSCRIIFTIHYMGWCTLIKGDKTYFKEIIQKDDSERTDVKEKSVYDDYSKMKNVCQLVDNVICLSSYTYDLLHVEYGIRREQLVWVPNGLKDEAVVADKVQKHVINEVFGFRS